jgi:hypothetical protein
VECCDFASRFRSTSSLDRPALKITIDPVQSSSIQYNPREIRTILLGGNQPATYRYSLFSLPWFSLEGEGEDRVLLVGLVAGQVPT